MQQLIGFGDSWAHGAGECQRTYLECSAQQLGMPWKNYAVSSSSIPHLVMQFNTFVSQDFDPEQQYIAVFFVSAVERTFFIDPEDNTVIHSSPCKIEIANNPIEKYYYQNYTDEYNEFWANTAILALQQLCDRTGIPSIFIPGWQTPVLWPTVDRDRFLFSAQHPVTALFGQTADQTFTELMNSGCEFWGETGHPNQLGHDVIAKALTKHIKTHILA